MGQGEIGKHGDMGEIGKHGTGRDRQARGRQRSASEGAGEIGKLRPLFADLSGPAWGLLGHCLPISGAEIL